MPVEFSVAAFRLGHSMVRAAYNWNRRFPGTGGFLDYMFEFSGLGGDLGGEIRLLSNWLADWRRMYDFAAGGRRARAREQRQPCHAHRHPADRPAGEPAAQRRSAAANIPFDDLRRNLAFRNLTRGNDGEARQRAADGRGSRLSASMSPR